jgi:hypothetical protein
MMKKFLALAGLGLLAVATPAQAQLGLLIPKEKTAVKEGFSFPADGEIRIAVLRPDVAVGEMSLGGLNQPNADWTSAARKNMADALQGTKASAKTTLKFMPELQGDDEIIMAEYRALFKNVTDAVVVHKLFPGNRLPTKKEAFDWSLGKGVSKLGELGGGDYGLFFYSEDRYTSSTGKIMKALIGGPPPVHIGYAGLVDLTTGDLVWINADIEMGGDPRETEGAKKRVKQLLEGFPMRGTEPVLLTWE